MSDWPAQLQLIDPMTAIHWGSNCSIGGGAGFVGTPASAIYPTANLAIYIPFRIPRPIVVTKLWAWNGTVVSGNIDVGIYDATGTRLISAGSTAQAGTSAKQEFNIADTEIGPGLFYIATAMNNTTGTLHRVSALPVELMRLVGCAEQTTAFALPATATFAKVATAAYLPMTGLSIRTVV